MDAEAAQVSSTIMSSGRIKCLHQRGLDVALDYTERRFAKPFVLGLFAGQHANGDVGTCCVDFNATTREPLPAGPGGPKSGHQTPFTKADVTTDAEASLVSMYFKYVRNTKDTAILDEMVVSQQDRVNRTVRERLGMLLGYLGNSSGRFHEGYGLVWGGTCADWGAALRALGDALEPPGKEQSQRREREYDPGFELSGQPASAGLSVRPLHDEAALERALNEQIERVTEHAKAEEARHRTVQSQLQSQLQRVESERSAKAMEQRRAATTFKQVRASLFLPTGHLPHFTLT